MKCIRNTKRNAFSHGVIIQTLFAPLMRCPVGVLPRVRHVLVATFLIVLGYEISFIKLPVEDEPQPQNTDPTINCQHALTLTDPEELKVKYGGWKPSYSWSNLQLKNMLANCADFKRTFGFDELLTRPSQSDLPAVAYAALVHDYAESFVRLLQVLLSADTVVAVAYDTKAPDDFIGFVHRLAACLPNNVLLADVNIAVYWGQSSIMESYLNALQRLLDHHPIVAWSYVQMITASDFPLKTPREMAEIFNIFNGSLDVELIQDTPDRHRYVWEMSLALTKPSDWVDQKRVKFGRFYKTKQMKTPPHALKMYRGSVAATLSYQFVDWLLNNQIAKDLRDYLQTAIHSEESLVASLVHNTGIGVPGTFPGECVNEYTKVKKGLRKPWYARYTVWPEAQSPTRKCTGRFVRGSCQAGIGDLPDLINRPDLFGHKIQQDYQPALLYCLTFELQRRQALIRKDSAAYFSSESWLRWARVFKDLPQVKYNRLSDEDKKRLNLSELCGQPMDPTV